jgi:hypothetical protein
MTEAKAVRRKKDIQDPQAEYVARNGDKLRREGGKIWSEVRQKWLVETPEEFVRQEYLLILLHEYGFAIEQIDEEAEVTGRGPGHARADFVIWRSAKDKADINTPVPPPPSAARIRGRRW